MNAWLYAIATNLAFGVFRRRRILSFLSLGTLGNREIEADAADPAVSAGDRELVTRVLSRLPRRDAAYLLLYFQQGLSYSEMAAVLGVSVPAAKMRLSRARAAFRETYLSLYEESS